MLDMGTGMGVGTGIGLGMGTGIGIVTGTGSRLVVVLFIPVVVCSKYSMYVPCKRHGNVHIRRLTKIEKVFTYRAHSLHHNMTSAF